MQAFLLRLDYQAVHCIQIAHFPKAIRTLSQRWMSLSESGAQRALSCLTRAVLLDVFPKEQKATGAEKARQPLIKYSLGTHPSTVSRGSVPLDKLFLWPVLLSPARVGLSFLTGNFLCTVHSLWVTPLWLPVHGPLCLSFIPHCGRLVQAPGPGIQENANRLRPCSHRVNIPGE